MVNVIAGLIIALVLGLLMIRRAPNAKWMIIVLMTIIIGGGVATLYLKNGSALFVQPLKEQRIAYISAQDGRSDLWTMRLDGSDKVRLTNDSAEDRSPSWSSDGSEIVSISDRIAKKYQILVTGWDGRYSKLVTATDGIKDSPRFVGNTRTIVYMSNGRIFTVPSSGGEEEQILPPHESTMSTQGTSPFVHAAFSSNAEYLVCVQRTDANNGVVVMETPNGQLPSNAQDIKTITQVGGKELYSAWSPVKPLLCVSGAGLEGGNLNALATLNLETMENKNIYATKGDSTAPGQFEFSPDGSKIAFELWKVSDGVLAKCTGVYVVSSDGGKPVCLIAGDARRPSWSGDGKYVVCTKADDNGKRDIWRINADGSNPVNLTKGQGDNYDAACSPMPKSKQ